MVAICFAETTNKIYTAAILLYGQSLRSTEDTKFYLFSMDIQINRKIQFFCSFEWITKQCAKQYAQQTYFIRHFYVNIAKKAIGETAIRMATQQTVSSHSEIICDRQIQQKLQYD